MVNPDQTAYVDWSTNTTFALKIGTHLHNTLTATIEGLSPNQFSHFSIKTYVVGTLKNHLNETVLLSTQNICYD